MVAMSDRPRALQEARDFFVAEDRARNGVAVALVLVDLSRESFIGMVPALVTS